MDIANDHPEVNGAGDIFDSQQAEHSPARVIGADYSFRVSYLSPRSVNPDERRRINTAVNDTAISDDVNENHRVSDVTSTWVVRPEKGLFSIERLLAK